MLLTADALAQRGPGSGPPGGGGGMQPGAGGGTPQGGARAGGGRGTANRNPPARPPRRPPPVTATSVRIERRVYTFEPTGEMMPYALFLPRKLDRKKPAPLLIALHGKGVPPETIIGTFVPGADRYGYIVAAPMGYNTNGWYGLQGPTDAETARLSELDVMNVLGIVRAEFNVDPRRIYIAGHSMGGIGAVYLAAKYPDIWAAVGAMSPGFTRGSMQNEKIGAYNAAPVIVEHGTRDEVASIDLVRDWVAGLKERNVPMKYYEYRGGNHVATLQGGADRVFEFFGKHSRAQAKTEP